MGDHYQHKQAARVAYEVWIGPIPDEARIVTKCGTPGCIAPHHLYAKSKEMFHLDMQAEKYGQPPRARGGQGTALRAVLGPDSRGGRACFARSGWACWRGS